MRERKREREQPLRAGENERNEREKIIRRIVRERTSKKERDNE